MTRAARVAATLAVLGTLATVLAVAQTPPGATAPAGSAAIVRIGAEPYVGVNDLARLLEATKYWRADVRKLVLRTRAHRIVLTVDNPFVLVDAHVVRLRAPVRMLAGEVHAPLALADSLPSDSTLVRLVHGPGIAGLLRIPSGTGALGTPRVAFTDSTTRITFPGDREAVVAVLGRAKDRFRLRLDGTFVGVLPDSFPDVSLVRVMRLIPSASGTAFELSIAPGTQGFRLTTDPSRHAVTLELGRFRGGEPFAPEDAAGGRALRVIAIDPGHGGGDRGVVAGGAVEKDLALGLARLLRVELERRLAVQVVLTRDDDRDVPVAARAERVNQARADLVIALHFDGVPGTPRRGATAWCPPARLGVRPGAERRTAPVPVVPWRDVSQRHAVRSRALAEAVLGALELHGEGPTRLRERLAHPLLGMNAPALMLDCATLTSGVDRARLSEPGGLRQLAVAIADGVANYRETVR